MPPPPPNTQIPTCVFAHVWHFQCYLEAVSWWCQQAIPLVLHLSSTELASCSPSRFTCRPWAITHCQKQYLSFNGPLDQSSTGKTYPLVQHHGRSLYLTSSCCSTNHIVCNGMSASGIYGYELQAAVVWKWQQICQEVTHISYRYK